MSDRLTSVDLPGVSSGYGLADYGLKTPAEMIAALRLKAIAEKKAADAILSAKDEDFHVETYLGVHVRRMRKVLQKGNKA